MTPELLNSARPLQAAPLQSASYQSSIGQNPATQNSPVNLLFVDSSIDNIDTLISQVKDNTQVIRLDGQSNGISQITDALANYQDVASLSVVSHGESGQLQLGASTISSTSLSNVRDELQEWQTSLTVDADILFYGCNVAAGQQGEHFLNQFSELTGADVAASDDLTGSSRLGGDWQLEVSTGQIEADSPFHSSVADRYQSVLQGNTIFSGSNEKGLGDYRIHSKTKHGVNVVSNPSGSGKVLRFDLRKGDPLVSNSSRAEVLPKISDTTPKFGQNYTYSLRTYIPNDWKADGSLEIITQWHAKPDSHLGETWRNPPAALRIQGDSFNLKQAWDSKAVTKKNTNHGSRTTNLGSLNRGKWTDWSFEIKWSYKSDGIFRVYKDGKLVFNKTGPNAFNDKLAPFSKLGIYKPDWKARPQNSSTTRRVLYIDDFTMRTGHGKGARIQSIPEQPQTGKSNSGGNSGSNNNGGSYNSSSNSKTSSAIRVEAESLQLSNYRVEKNSSASGNKAVSLRGKQSNETGRAVYVHKGSRGTYDLDLKYFDEKDGAGKFQVKLNGKTLEGWTLDSRTGSPTANAKSRRSRTIEGLTLKSGDRLAIVGQERGGDPAVLDSLVLTPAGGSNTQQNNQNRSGSNGFIKTYQAEHAKLVSVSTRKGNSKAQGGRYVKFDRSSNDAIEYKIDVPAAGRYRLDWRYAQGDKTRSPLKVAVNGKTDQSSPRFASTGGWNNWDWVSDTVYLKKGSNTIRLRTTGKTSVSIDALRVAAV
ncbi:MAG: DUF4347 domain-containing protein [Cyanobacteria bacterium P01_E01_bin.45]